MKAITQTAYGDGSVLHFEEIPDPVPAPDQVLVRVRAAGVNMAEWHFMTGTPRIVRLVLGKPRGRVLGADVAGVVEAVGAEVTRFAVGDEVFGSARGSFAELALTSEKRLAPKPSGVSFEAAAATPMAGYTAVQALGAAKIEAGDEVLVIGAGGGVGSFAVQLAVAAGARVTGVGSAGKQDLIRSLGAAEAVDYATDDLSRFAGRFDAILDIAGGRPLRLLRRLLTADGVAVLVGNETGTGPLGGLDRNLRAALVTLGSKQRIVGLMANERPESLETLRTALEAGAIAPAVDRTLPVARAAEALDELAANRVLGKLVLVP